MRYQRILSAFFGSVWAILPEKYEAMREFLRLKAEGVRFGAEEIAARVNAAKSNRVEAEKANEIAVIPVYGIISQRIHMMDDISGPGGTATNSISRDLKAALADPSVGAIVLDVDSPGGTVYGVQEVAEEIFKARGQKPILAAVDSLAASAAYWIASAADEIAVTPSGEVGSIGVFAEHMDYSKWLENEGMKPTLISAGKYKVEGNQYAPLEDEARAYIQQRVDDYYQAFVKAVARNRGATVARVKSDFGEGRTVGAERAVESGMADRVAAFDQVLVRAGKLAGKRAAAEPPPIIAEAAPPAVEAQADASAAQTEIEIERIRNEF